MGEEPDDYTVQFYDKLCNVDTIALASAQIPFCAATIARGNDEFVIRPDTSSSSSVSWHRVRLAHGNVDDAAALAQRVNDALPAGYSADTDDGTLRITSSLGAFRVDAQALASRVCGQHPADNGHVASQIVGGENVVTFPYTPDLDPEPYLLVKLNVGGGIVSPVDAADGALAVAVNGAPDIAVPTPAKCERRELSRMKVSIVRPNGQPYDFAGRDHRLEFFIDG